MSITKVLITGVAGFIGSNLLDYLIDKTDWNIVGVDNLSTGNLKNIKQHFDNDRFIFLNGNCTIIDCIKPYQYIFHLAALPRIQPSYDLINEHINANLIQAMHLIQLMINENWFPRFVYSSSSSIYGNPKQFPTSELEQIDCLSPYAFQKYEVEKYLELLSERYPINYINLRYFNPYGPRSFNPENNFNAYSSVVGIFIYRKQQNLPLIVTGDGSQKRDFIHVKDLAAANYLAAIHPNKINTSFNIGFGSTLSVLDLAKNLNHPYQFIKKREGEADITFADITKANVILDWSPSLNILEYLKQF